MKKLFFLSTRLRIFLIELPPVLLLIPSVIYNGNVDTLMKLYPLIAVLSGLIVFFFLYFFRGVMISFEEVKCIGPFSSKDKEFIKEGRTLTLTQLKRRRISIELSGINTDGELTYAWLKNDEPVEINLFRAKANGSKKQILKILRYFGADISDFSEITENVGKVIFESDEVKITADKTDELNSVRIYFKKTV